MTPDEAALIAAQRIDRMSKRQRQALARVYVRCQGDCTLAVVYADRAGLLLRTRSARVPVAVVDVEEGDDGLPVWHARTKWEVREFAPVLLVPGVEVPRSTGCRCSSEGWELPTAAELVERAVRRRLGDKPLTLVAAPVETKGIAYRWEECYEEDHEDQ